MKKIMLVWLVLSSFAGLAQQDAWVYFTAKPNAQQYLDNPLQMLSQRALDRRANQNIPLDSKDLPVYEPYSAAIAAASGITVMAKSKWLNALHIRGAQNDINALLTLDFVTRIDFANKALNVAGKNTIQSSVTMANKNQETAANFNYGTSSNQIQMLNGQLLHQQGYTGSGKIIAVLDAGFPGVNTAQPFQRLLNNNQILGGYDFVNRNENMYTGNSHGTMVLSTMGGYKENSLVGTAPDASYYLFITENAASENPLEESLWVEAAEMADSLGVDVINTSLGYNNYDNPAYSYTYADMNGTTSFIARGADIAFSRGMIVVVSAGNDGSTAWHYIATPADAFNVLTVGAVTATENYAAFSSVGPTADGRIKPDVMAQGQAAVVSGTTGTIATNNGTSFSGPIIAGMVASLWQALPTKTNVEIVQIIRQSSDRFTAPNDQYGYGIPDFAQALSTTLAVADSVLEPFVAYPNPVDAILYFKLPVTTDKATLTLYNSFGQMIAQKEINAEHPSIEVGNLNTGIYFYSLAAANGTRTGKISKK
ncbi:S8 family serine peptidase [Flavobacterium kingsejongi]|uniref:Peptidase S8 n=1 Tax=Flavobacterium kingsejongi TaxID=1678728 RepID=A0A2S1LU84_9FLAO|nr:S8 family serine peptidase [Flavobacterium kingsejongi]AWG27317.1 peptidase S8 [Flavobacterium kingsejongi]